MIETLLVLGGLGIIGLIVFSIVVNPLSKRISMLEQDLQARSVEILKLQASVRILNTDIEYGTEYGKAVYKYMMGKDLQFMRQELRFEKRINPSKGLVSTEGVT